MRERARYLLGRAFEAGLVSVLIKLWQKATPVFYWPAYQLRPPRSGAADSVSFELFGQQVREAINKAVSSDPAYLGRIGPRVVDAMSGEVTVLGYGRTNAPAGQDWHADPIHGHVWPCSYFAFMDYVASNVRSDVKIPWEMSRLQRLVWLAEGATVLGGQTAVDCRQTGFALLRDWENSNRTGYGVNWTCGMEVAIRAVNIAIGASALAEEATDADRALITNCLRKHLDYLERFPEVSDLPGNHYLTNLLGMAVIRMALYGTNAAKTAAAFSRFAEEADRQFDADGFHVERATIYHRLCLDMVALALALADRAQIAAKNRLMEVFSRATAFVAAIASDSGRLPVYGDQDSGFVLWFGEAAQQLDGRLLASKNGKLTDQYTFLLNLCQDRDLFERLSPDELPTHSIKSGVAIIRKGDICLVMKGGELGLGGRAPHDHDDALHVWIFLRGVDVLVDAGCHSYTLEKDKRLVAIRSSSHNTPRIDGRENSEPVAGSVMPTVRGAPRAHVAIEDDGSAVGHLTLHNDCKVKRHISIVYEENDTSVIIRDSWRSRHPRKLTSKWHLAPKWKVEALTDTSKPDASVARLITEDANPSEIDVLLRSSKVADLSVGQENISPDYGALNLVNTINVKAKKQSRGWYEIEFRFRHGHSPLVKTKQTRD